MGGSFETRDILYEGFPIVHDCGRPAAKYMSGSYIGLSYSFFSSGQRPEAELDSFDKLLFPLFVVLLIISFRNDRVWGSGSPVVCLRKPPHNLQSKIFSTYPLVIGCKHQKGRGFLYHVTISACVEPNPFAKQCWVRLTDSGFPNKHCISIRMLGHICYLTLG